MYGRMALRAQAVFQRLIQLRAQLLVRQGVATYSSVKRQASSELWAPHGLHPAQSKAIFGRMQLFRGQSAA